MFGFFRRKKVIEQLKLDVQRSFDSVKNDFVKVGQWINHIDDKQNNHDGEILKIKTHLLELQGDLEEIKELFSFFGSRVSKHHKTAINKQTAVEVVQTGVQTGVQTDFLPNLTIMERAIIWALLNAEMKLSYEDIAALLGKDKSTIRGQINTIKQKSEGLIEEIREKNGKKRLYIPEKMKDFILKSVKVRVKKKKNSEEINEK